MRRLIRSLCHLLLAAWLAAAGISASASAATGAGAAAGTEPGAAATDQRNARAHAIAGAAPTPPRVITLAPHATEMVYAAGGGHLMAGTVDSSDFPESARRLPRVGDGITLNQERIIMLRPTVLVGWLRSGAALNAEVLARSMGASMVYSRPTRLRDIPADVRRIGSLLGTEETARQRAAAMEARIGALEGRYAALSPVTVFVELGSAPLYTIGGDPLLNDAMRVCGATNIYGSSALPAPPVPIEGVLVQNPQLIVVAPHAANGLAEVQARWGRYGLAAARLGNLHGADPDALFRPGPRFIDATEALCLAVDRVRRTHENELSLEIRSN